MLFTDLYVTKITR